MCKGNVRKFSMLFLAEDVLVVLGENFEKRVDTERVFDA
jgi:hypothetical protein